MGVTPVRQIVCAIVHKPFLNRRKETTGEAIFAGSHCRVDARELVELHVHQFRGEIGIWA